MQNGWIKLHRGLLEWEWYDDINTCRLFVHCLLRANHADKLWRGKEIKRGSFFTSLDSLSTETGLSARQIRTSLSKLESTGEVTSSGQARGRMITVVQYDSYQSDDKLSVSQKSGKSQADDRLATTNKNDKNEKNVISNIGDKSPAKAKRFVAPDFQEVAVYFFERTNDRDLSAKEAQKFVSFYESKGWIVGKTKMKDWKAAVRGWISRLSDKPKTAQEQRAESAAKAFDYDYQMNQLEGL